MKTSFISHKPIPKGESIQGSEIRSSIFELIRKEHPGFNVDCYVALDELNLYRRLYLSQLMELERGELVLLDRDVLQAIRENSILTEKIEDNVEALFLLSPLSMPWGRAQKNLCRRFLGRSRDLGMKPKVKICPAPSSWPKPKTVYMAVSLQLVLPLKG